MTCTRCGAKNRDRLRFCSSCGAPLVAACPACSGALEADDAFCGHCGAALPGTESAAAKARPPTPQSEEPDTELRLVSLLFCDLVGFTTISEARDPEDVRDLLTKYFDRCREIIDSYGGTIEKFIGDAVMAVWGAPVANEDDAERAVRAALEVVNAVALLGKRENAPGLQARGGVLTGEVVADLAAKGQGMVAGDVVNTASRLQSAAEPGTVLVGDETHEATYSAIAYAEHGELQLKGKAEPVRAWQALRVIGQRRGLGAGQRLEPPFTGRDEELLLLKDLLQAAGREPRARLISITGVPGIGKSRLAWELEKYVDGLASAIYWHQGHCPAYGDGISFWALGEMVRMRAGITEAEAADASQAKLEAMVTEFIVDPDERKRVLPGLASLLGLAESPTAEREELFAAWRTLFERISQRGTTVMVFEDLQWADPGLIDFIESILEWSRSHALVLITLSRPELMERRPSWGAHQPNFTSIHLDPLPDQAMQELLLGLVRGLPDDLEKRLRERAEGVPLYAVETVRMLVDQGQLVERPGGYEAVGDLSQLEVPSTLHALIASRLDSIGPESRDLLQDASVLGQTFFPDSLAALTGLPPQQLEAKLRELVRKELLVAEGDPRAPTRGQYHFIQSLIREVAYSTISRRDRLERHLAAAHWFESQDDDELAGVVAAHYLEAHRAASADEERQAVATEARKWLAQAGGRALGLGSPEQALGYFEHALEVAPDGPFRAELLAQAGQAAAHAAASAKAAQYLAEATRFHRAAGDHVQAALTVARLMRTLIRQQSYHDAIQEGERAFAALGPEGDHGAKAEVAVQMASAEWHALDPVKALAWAETALENMERMDEATLLGPALGARADALLELGRRRESEALTRGRVAHAEKEGHLLEQSVAMGNLGNYVQDDSLREAVATGLQAADLSRTGGYREVEAMALLNVVEMALALGEWGIARGSLARLEERPLDGPAQMHRDMVRSCLRAYDGELDAALQELQSLQGRVEADGNPDSVTTFHVTLATVRWLRGELEEAYQAAGAERDELGVNALRTLAVRARAALWLRDPDRAAPVLRKMSRFGGRVAAAHRLTVEAGLAALNEPAAAAEQYRRAAAAWEQLESPLGLATCQLDQALLQGDDPEALEAAAAARRLFEQLPCPPLLERLAQGVPAAGQAEKAESEPQGRRGR